MKLELNIRALKTIQTEYVIGADSSDAVLVKPLANIIDAFLTFQSQLVFNAENDLWPQNPNTITDVWRKEQVAASTYGPFRFLNSGLWMGRREFCIEFFRACMNADILSLVNTHQLKAYSLDSDQTRAHYSFGKFPGQVKMDCECKLFQNLAFVTDSILEMVRPSIL